VTLDAEAQAAIGAALAACAERQRADDAAYERGGEAMRDAIAANPDEPFARAAHDMEYRGELVPAVQIDDAAAFVEGEPHWSAIGEEDGLLPDRSS
jgi:hypothetical protein